MSHLYKDNAKRSCVQMYNRRESLEIFHGCKKIKQFFSIYVLFLFFTQNNVLLI